MSKKGSRFSRSTRGTMSRRTMSKNARGSVRVVQRAFPTPEVWVEDKDGWVCCKILEEDGSVLSLQNTKTREIFAIDSAFRDIYPCNNVVVSDMTSLRHHSEPGILHNVKQRWLAKGPYTFMGSVLIAVNPCEWYDHADINMFVGKPINPDNSHPFAIAGDSTIFIQNES
jgi:myosin heavy subunit